MNKIVTAQWCGPCKMLKGEIKNANIEVEYIDADDNMDFCNKLGITSIPTLITSEKEIITGYPEILKKLNIL
tara:strand:+ start:603 stop:818 length:216 start_codon:yes stop_codon:yes gene_type:complete